MHDSALTAQVLAFLQVLLIDLTLAGDNAIVVGLAVNGLPPAQRRKAVLLGIAAATILRIALATITLQLLAIVGLVLAGGLLLLWVCWKMARELRRPKTHQAQAPKSLGQAMLHIIIADLSMSLDNVLAVAGAAHGHPLILAAGLALSVVLMAAAANLVARLLQNHPWLAWAGLAIVLYVSLKMIWDGAHDVAAAI